MAEATWAWWQWLIAGVVVALVAATVLAWRDEAVAPSWWRPAIPASIGAAALTWFVVTAGWRGLLGVAVIAAGALLFRKPGASHTVDTAADERPVSR